MDDLIVWLRMQLDEDERVARAALFIASHDPARALREVEARRQIIAECARTLEYEDYGYTLAEKMLRATALLYVDRPGYRKEWQPA